MENRHFKFWPMAASFSKKMNTNRSMLNCLERFLKIRFVELVNFEKESNFIFYFVVYKETRAEKVSACREREREGQATISISSQRSSRAVFRAWKTEPPHIFRNVGFAGENVVRAGNWARECSSDTRRGWSLCSRFVSYQTHRTHPSSFMDAGRLHFSFPMRSLRFAQGNRKLITVIVIIDNRGIRRRELITPVIFFVSSRREKRLFLIRFT